MSIRKMTFSLASLTLIIALALCLPVDAAEQARNTGVTGSLVVPGNGFAIVGNAGQIDSGIPTETVLGANYTEGTNMPDLSIFFARGGTITLLGQKGDATANPVEPTATAKSVVISEIMWGRDAGITEGGIAAQANRQYIELYNTTADPITVVLVGGDTATTIEAASWSLIFTNGRPVPKTIAEFNGANDADSAAPVPDRTGMIVVDQVSNVEIGGFTVDIGQSGNTMAGDSAKDLISMYRNIDYAKVEKGDHDTDTAKNRTAQLSGVPNGNVKGSWKASHVADTYAPNLVGSPGSKHFVGLSVVDATDVGYDVVINEIGNSSGDAHDWVELRNTGDAEVNLKKWQLWQITGEKSKATLVNFPDNDNHKIPAGGVLLIVNTDPYNDDSHPIAAGARINGAHLDTTGTKSRYYVDSNLKLADSGKSLLLLRSRNDGGDHEGIVDLTGTLFIQDFSAGFSTEIWPLKGTAKGNDNNGHGDVVKGADEDFRAGHVYQRINAGRGTGKEVWERKGYTGIGYKRSARNTGQNGGTPGFDNAASKDKASDLADGAAITISEIMYQTGRNLPQWIELYNSSATQAVNLGAWKLKLENADDAEIRTPAVTTNNLGGTIQPGQTVLIVSTTTGRNSGDFPSTRVINLWDQKDKLEVDNRRYQLLSTTAFRITLMQKDHKDGETPVDVAGNMGDDGEAMWELPAAAEGEVRSSIIRRYGDTGTGVEGEYDPARDGTMADAWVAASATNLSFIREDTYYGSNDDIGTPGYRGGGALPVSLSKFRPERLESGEIVVRWVTESELNNAGFNILRSDARDGEFTKINTALIAGQGTTSERTAYEWKDTSAKPNVVYYYQIQDVSLDGDVQTLRTSRLKGDISADGKLTTTWGELKALQ